MSQSAARYRNDHEFRSHTCLVAVLVFQNSWALPDLQNKDTGELPVLQVYQLEPLPMGKDTVASMEGVDMAEDAKTANADKDDSNADEGAAGEDENQAEAPNENGGTSTEESPRSEESQDSVIVNGDKSTAKEFAHAKRVDIHTEPISNAETKGASQAPDVKFSFLALSQRKTEMSTGDMLHPFTHHVFGTPLLLRVVDLEGYSGRDLYDLVAKRMRNFVPNSALRFLTDHKDDPRQEEDYEEKTEDSALMPRAGSRKRRHRTTTDMEEVAAGPVPRYGFRLRLASRDGRRCALCPWYECCIGCLVPDDDYPTIVTCGDSIVIDWHFAVDIATSGFGFRPNQLDHSSGQAPVRAKQFIVPVKNHSSYGNGAKKSGSGASAVTLEQCLDAFAEEERIPEVSNCIDIVWVALLVLVISHSFILNFCAGILLSMPGLSSADKAHESLEVTTSRHYTFEALPVYTARTSKTARLGYLSD